MPRASILFNIARICNSQLKSNYLENEKHFPNFLFHLWNLHQISNILKRKVMVIANVFPELQTVKNFVRPLSKKRCFGRCFDSQHVNLSQLFAKSPWEWFCHVFESCWEKLVWKMSSVLLGEILEIFLNRLLAEGKYPFEDLKDFRLPIQMQISEKPKKFFSFH